MNSAIVFDTVTKQFGSKTALDGLTFEVAAGEVFGFLGPNGAGKTTALRILLDAIRATSGTVTALGLDSRADSLQLHGRLAYVPGDVAIWPQLTGGQTIDALLALRGHSGAPRKQELIEKFQLDPTVRGKAYSKGNRQKVALIAALAADTELLILDEPTSGLDPLMEELFRRELASARDRGQTVLLSSHILGEVEHVCDRVGIIREGRLVEVGTLADLRQLSAHYVEAVVGQQPGGQLAAIGGVSGVTVEAAGEAWIVRCQVEASGTAALMRSLAKLNVQSLTSAPPSLEQIFLRYYDSAPAAPGVRP